MAEASYTGKDITVLEGLDPVRLRPGMYIGSTGARGLHQLAYEVIDNAVDEALAGRADTIEMTVHPDASVTVTDNGSGIPVDVMPEQGLSALAVADGPATWAARAAALRPELDTDPARAILTTWNDDPWAGESYTADTLTAAPADPDLLAAPADRIHFAGEHTAGQWAALMEGRPAIRAARCQRGARQPAHCPLTAL